ncbi:MAG: hypothetical protein ACFCUH_08625 [Flavobacteriales bacterium]
MFQEATIVYFDPFYFKNGNVAKPKYFIVLKRFNEQQLLASLPTRKDAIPNAHATEADPKQHTVLRIAQEETPLTLVTP